MASCRGSFRDFVEQAFGLLLQRENIGGDLAEGAELGRLVEVAGEADFVADLGVGINEPRVRCVGQDFAPDEGFDAAFLQQRNLLEVAEFGVGLVFHDAGLAADLGLEQAAQGVGLGLAGFVDFLDDAGRIATFTPKPSSHPAPHLPRPESGLLSGVLWALLGTVCFSFLLFVITPRFFVLI